MFMRYISHEIRTPLNVIFMGLKLIEDELSEHDDLAARRLFSTVRDAKSSAASALDVLNDLLLMDKIHEGLLVPDLTDEDPIALLNDTILPFLIQVSSRLNSFS